MAHYLVTATPKKKLIAELKKKIDERAFMDLKPFGASLSYSLENARHAPDGRWKWEELDYCSPPLKQEREQVLDRYFILDEIEPVSESEGWEEISDLPRVSSG